MILSARRDFGHAVCFAIRSWFWIKAIALFAMYTTELLWLVSQAKLQ